MSTVTILSVPSLGTVTFNKDAVAVFTVARVAPNHTMLLAGVVLNPAPLILIVAPGIPEAALNDDILGTGVTLMVKFCTGPTQLFAVGVTVNTPDIGDVVKLVAVNEAIAPPLPDNPIPMDVLLFAQVYVVPVTFEVKISVEVFVFAQTVCEVGVTDIIGVGFTFMVNVLTAPIQLAAVGVTVNMPLVCVVPVFVAVNDVIKEPLPDAPIPIVVLLFAQV